MVITALRKLVNTQKIDRMFVQRRYEREHSGFYYQHYCTIVIQYGDNYRMVKGQTNASIERWIKERLLKVADGFDIEKDQQFVLLPIHLASKGE